MNTVVLGPPSLLSLVLLLKLCAYEGMRKVE